MYRLTTVRAMANRRGVILLVVLSLLTLFAVVGISFVLYADAEAEASRLFREAQAPTDPDVEPELALAYFLGLMIYDSDDTVGYTSSLRGHSFARTMYGWNSDAGATNDKPFNGTGRLHTSPGTFGVDDFQLINYMYFQIDGKVRDPERQGPRTNPQAPVTSPYTSGWNAPYTYPDLNNVMLAAINADGKVLAISGHRDYLFNPGRPLNDMSNPNWTNPLGKYMTLRPRPADHLGFPPPEDDRGDVKNLTGFPGGNDSIWIDMGFPVKTTADGRKFKMLVAPLILDMDGRINLDAHGNVRGVDPATNAPTHASNQGYGKTEVNLGKVLNAGLGATPMEWTNLFLGNARLGMPGRYGPIQRPDGALSLENLHMIPFYSGIDVDGCNELAATPFVPTAQMQLPAIPPQVGTTSFSCFPAYPQGYGNGSYGMPGTEWYLHPLLYNPLKPALDNRAFVWSEFEAIVRHSSTNSPALTSDLQRLCPQNFALARVRNQVTTHSFHVDRPAVSPYIWDPASSTFIFDPAVLAAALKKVDLDRPLQDYPNWRSSGRLDLTPDPCTGQSALITVQQALDDRQRFAMDIFTALRLATGTPDPSTVFTTAPIEPPGNPADPKLPQFQAMRSLAQLAVNIVDFIDKDDFITPFAWFTDSNQKPSYVFGTELPRAVINETYVELQNPTLTTGNNYSVNFWLELLNPLQKDPNLSAEGFARLNMPGDKLAGIPDYPVHVIYINQKPVAPGVSPFRQPWNVAGDPDATTLRSVVWDYSGASLSMPLQTAVTAGTADANLITTLNDTGINNTFSGPIGMNQGFLVLGPTGQGFQGVTDPNAPIPSVTVPSAAATATVPRQGLVADSGIAATTVLPLNPPLNYSIALRRLAYPAIPPNPPLGSTTLTAGMPYNPYVTVDYVDTVQVNDAVATRPPTSVAIKAIADRQAVGRRQPYAADTSQQVVQAPNPKLTGQPQTTFFRHNAVKATPPPAPTDTGPNMELQTIAVPFDWLVHLDRPLLSPMELLHVSAFKPHELTQQFMLPNQSFAHRAPWYDENRRLYRFFEYVGTHDPGYGCVRSGRIPGRININSIWGAETFRALCDAQPVSNYFTEGATPPDDVNRIFQDLMKSRSPTGGIGPNDVPFLPLSTGVSQVANGPQFADVTINNTLLRLGSSAINPQPLFDPLVQTTLPTYGNNPGNNHPYVQKALLNKIFNNLTTRSNVFAVWLTVGFFEVKDDTTQPVKLGAEIGRSENRHIRHRMFALVDRSSLTTFTTQVIPDNGGVFTLNSPLPLNLLMPMSGTDPRTGRNWQVQAGTVLNIDQGVADPDNGEIHEENVVAVMVNGTLSATFTATHPPGAKIQCYANPGPWQRYDPRQDTTVVPYFSIID